MTLCKNCGHEIKQLDTKEKEWCHFDNGFFDICLIPVQKNNGYYSRCDCTNPEPSYEKNIKWKGATKESYDIRDVIIVRK